MFFVRLVACVIVTFRMHYTLSAKNQKTVPQEYTINLMWINRKLDNTQQYIYPASNQEELAKKFLSHIYKWASVNQDSTIHLWFDSLLTPTTAVKNTEKLIVEHGSKYPKLAPIVLRDVRQLDHVIANPEVFSEKTPIFFRVDLLRIIAQVHDITTGITPYFVYSDLDIDPLSREEIFDKETLDKLQKFGIVMAYHPIWLGFENSFSIISNHNIKLIQAMTYTQINLNIARANNALQGKFFKTEHVSELIPLVEKHHIINQDNGSVEPLTIPQNYSINIIWINHDLKKDQRYIHPGLNEEELQEYFFQPIFTWAAMNPAATINLWFDSVVTPSIAVKNTAQFINNTHPEMSNIVLRDVRELPYVKKHPDIFSPKLFSHTREHLLQIIAAMFDIETGRASYCVYGGLLDLVEYMDLFDIKSLSAQEIFDEKSLKDLQTMGITSISRGGIEKGIIGGNTTHLFEILTRNWLEPNIEKAYEKLQGKDCCNTCCESLAALQQIIYCSYPSMFKYFYHHEGFGNLTVEHYDRPSKQFINRPYDKDQDGLEPFGLDRLSTGGYFNETKQLEQTGIGRIWIPTKKIAHPKPTLVYDDDAPVRAIPLQNQSDQGEI